MRLRPLSQKFCISISIIVILLMTGIVLIVMLLSLLILLLWSFLPGVKHPPPDPCRCGRPRRRPGAKRVRVPVFCDPYDKEPAICRLLCSYPLVSETPTLRLEDSRKTKKTNDTQHQGLVSPVF